MARNKQQKDRTGVIISVTAHVVVIGAVLFWLTATEQGQMVGRRILEAIRPEKDKVKEPPPPPPATKEPPKPLPKINEGAEPRKGGGTRRGVASDAPASAGESFFVDSRTQGTNTSGAGKGDGQGQKQDGKQQAIAPPKPPPRFDFRPPVATGAGSTAKLLAERQSSTAVSDSIGSEAIDRTGSSDAGDVVSKVTGTSIVDGKFAVVRGLSDRYTMTLLNGAEIPTPDPYRRQVQLDIFPAKMISSINVTKTFTPDLPASFAGGIIDVQTKSFPEKFAFSFSAGTGYNPEANLRDDFLASDGGSLDWIGMDDGGRDLPKQLKNGPALPPAFSTRGETAEVAAERRAQAEKAAADTRSFKSTQLAPIRTDSPLNQSYNFSLGDTMRLFERPLGYFAGFDYKNNYSGYSDGIVQRFGGNGLLERLDSEDRFTHEVNWSAVFNLAYQPAEGHELGFNFLYNQSGEEVARHAEGRDFKSGSLDQTTIRNNLTYTERNLTTYQLKGSHTLAELNNVKLDWVGALSSTRQYEPDQRFFYYLRYPLEAGGTEGKVGDNSLPQPNRPTRFFRDINEDNKNIKADLTVPFRQWSDLESYLKFGGAASQAERTFDERTFTYQASSQTFRGGPNHYLDPEFLGFEAVPLAGIRTNYTFQRWITSDLGNSSYLGEQSVHAYYGMAELALTEKLRVIGGGRVESTDILITSFTPKIEGGLSTALNQVDVLPALGLVWAMRTNMNLRLNWGHTLARPAFRELAPIPVYDVNLDAIVVGNPDLKMVAIKNYDLRWEWFPRAGEVLSAGVFYKELENAIEAYSVFRDGSVITFINRPEATVFGIELEARRSLDFLDRHLANFSLGANFSFIKSETELFPDEYDSKIETDPDTTERTRPLYDQSPYIINLDLTYNNPKLGTLVSLGSNLSGKRIYLATGAGPDIYEHPPISLDLVISQRLSRHWKLKFGIKNMLNPVYQRTYGDEPDTNLYSENRRGRTYGISLSCDY